MAVWVHHNEWGLTSNTGGLLAAVLAPCRLLMKGLPEHDAWLGARLRDPAVVPVVLWPAREGGGGEGGGGGGGGNASPTAVTLAELRR